MPDLPQSARVVIIGGGISGCSVAYHLAELGWTDIVLLDEAFKGLDEQCRRDTAAYIRRHTAGASVLCVTHDPEEATLLGGRCIDLAALQRRD